MQEKILKLLQQQGMLSNAQLAAMMGATEAEVAAAMAALQADGTLLKFTALIDWDKTNREMVSAHIELRVTPQRGEGFDKVAERIYQYPEVREVSLMSGGYDLSVLIEGRTMKEVALFVAEKLAPMESVISTKTNFVLKRYKQDGVIFTKPREDERRVITL